MGPAAFLWALGEVPSAMAGNGVLALGPEPWALLPAGPFQLFLGAGEPRVGGRVRLLRGPWFAWADLPPPRLALGRTTPSAWLALVGNREGLNLVWEVQAPPALSLFGTLGDEAACGVRLRWRSLWSAAIVRGGGLTLWCGLYF
ncbi:MAG: hypothetical protein N2320_01425 [Candidatus Bipolaricaulota bacterium]|nr:hypothetical protein [Candidatus Bipolaricaulota bacterium]